MSIAKGYGFLMVFSCAVAFFPAAGLSEGRLLYENKEFGFSVLVPAGYERKSIRMDGKEAGLELKNKGDIILVQATGAGTDYEDMNFDQYVKIAAAAEIQGYEKLSSAEPLTSDYGIKGYKTYWEYVETSDPTDKEETGPETKIVGPIYYFPPGRNQEIGPQPVKVVMISSYAGADKNEELAGVVENICRSFRYPDAFKELLAENDNGKTLVVAKGQPFRLELPANPTTGYQWQIDKISRAYLKIKDFGFVQPSGKLLGAGGTSWWELVPLKTGETTLRLLYFRSWEGKDKAADRYSVNLLVKNPARSE